MNIRIYRMMASLSPYKHHEKRAWDLNDANNSLDEIAIYEGTRELFRSKCQTVSNTEGLIPGSAYTDTIDEGEFFIQPYVERRRFHCAVHGIVGARTLGGDIIGTDFCTADNKSRWLIHDWQKLMPSPAGIDTRVAWSAGCIVIPTKQHEKFSFYLSAAKDKVPCCLYLV